MSIVIADARVERRWHLQQPSGGCIGDVDRLKELECSLMRGDCVGVVVGEVGHDGRKNGFELWLKLCEQCQSHLQIEDRRQARSRVAQHVVPDHDNHFERQGAHPKLEQPAWTDLQQRIPRFAEPEETSSELYEHLDLGPETEQLERRSRIELARQLAEQARERPESRLLIAIEQKQERRREKVHSLHVTDLGIILRDMRNIRDQWVVGTEPKRGRAMRAAETWTHNAYS